MTGRVALRRAAAWLAVVAGLVLLVSGYAGVSAGSDEPEQLSYLVSGGIGSLLVLGIGVTLLLTADLSDQHAKLAELGSATGTPAATTVPPVRTAALAAVWALSAVLLYAGWDKAATADDRDGAVPGVTLGVGALLLTATAGSVSTLRLRRAVGAGKAQVLATVSAATTPAAAIVAGAGARSDRSGLFTAPGLTRYHRGGCPTLADVPAVPISGAPDPGLAPCRICEASAEAGT
jgi:hypothetical protein